MEAELMCGVCLEYFDKPLMLPCTHNFCKKCIEGILASNNRQSMFGNKPRYHLDCPLCQRSIDLERGIDSIPVNRILENIIALHKKEEPLASNEAAWKLDSTVDDSPCHLHSSQQRSLYCLTCNRAVCKLCNCVSDKSSGTIHKCVPIKEQADQYQMKISSAIAEIKRKVVPINDEIQLLKDMLEQIKANEDSIKNQLESQITGLIQSLKSQQEELTRQLHNDIMKIKRPIDEHLRKHIQLKKTIDDHIKRLNSIKTTKDTGLRIKLMKESERQLNSLLCFDMPMFGSKEMPIVDMPVWEVDKDSVLQTIHQLQWRKSGSKSDDSSHPSSTHSSRQSSREDDSLPKTPPITFEQSPSAMSFSDNTVTRSTMTKKQKPRVFDPPKCQDNIQTNSEPNTPLFQQVSSSQSVFSNLGGAMFKTSTQPSNSNVTSTANFSTGTSVQKSTNIPSSSGPGTRSNVKMQSPAMSYFTSLITPSSSAGQTIVTEASSSTQVSQPSTSYTQFSHVQPKHSARSVSVPREVRAPTNFSPNMPASVIPKSPSITHISRSGSATNLFNQNENRMNFVMPTPQASRSDTTNNMISQRENCSDRPVFPVPSTADFLPQNESSSINTATNTTVSQSRGFLKPKSEYGNKNEKTTSTLMAMVSDQGDISMDTVIKSMESVRLGVKDDSDIPANESNSTTNGRSVRIDRRASTGTTNLPTLANTGFRAANLPTISAQDFAPPPNQRSGSPSSGVRRTLKPKKKVSK